MFNLMNLTHPRHDQQPETRTQRHSERNGAVRFSQCDDIKPQKQRDLIAEMEHWTLLKDNDLSEYDKLKQDIHQHMAEHQTIKPFTLESFWKEALRELKTNDECHEVDPFKRFWEDVQSFEPTNVQHDRMEEQQQQFLDLVQKHAVESEKDPDLVRVQVNEVIECDSETECEKLRNEINEFNDTFRLWSRCVYRDVEQLDSDQLELEREKERMSPQKIDQQKIHCEMESKENEEMIRNVTAKLDSIHSEIERQRQTLKVKAKSDEESKHIPGRRKTKFTERKRISERSPTEYAEELRRLTLRQWNSW